MTSDFDTFTLLPSYSDLTSRRDVNLVTRITEKVTADIPIIGSPMSTVTEWEMAVELAKLGAVGAIHRYMTEEEQHSNINRVKSFGGSFGRPPCKVGAAIGATKSEKRIDVLMKEPRPDFLIGDIAHADMKAFHDTVKYIRATYGDDIQIISGNIATADAAERLYALGINGFRVGIGSGSVCTTRTVCGVGRNQLVAIADIHVQFPKIPITSCGGIRDSGDIVKALAAGADSVVIGRLFAASDESPAPRLPDGKVSYAGMASYFSEKLRVERTQEDPSDIHHLIAPEGKYDILDPTGPVETTVARLTGGIQAGLSYIGARTIQELQWKARWENNLGQPVKLA